MILKRYRDNRRMSSPCCRRRSCSIDTVPCVEEDQSRGWTDTPDPAHQLLTIERTQRVQTRHRADTKEQKGYVQSTLGWVAFNWVKIWVAFLQSGL